MSRKPAKVDKSAASTAQFPQPPAPIFERIRWDWIAAVLCMLLLAWIVTAGDWDLFPAGGSLETFYDAQAVSLLHGRIDVAPESIGSEAFQHDGKTYGYFGPTPALMRLPFELLMPGMYGRWNCLSMLMASALVIGALLLLMKMLERRMPPGGRRSVQRLLTAALIFAAAIGSTNFFVSAERKVYQEAILWGSALAFAQAVFLVCYLIAPSRKWLILTCAAGFLAFFARVSSGAGSLFSLLLVDIALLVPSARIRSFVSDCALPRRAAVALSATLVLSAALWAGLNYWKFGTPLTSLPMGSNKQFNKERTQRIKGDLASVYNLPITVQAYLSPSNVVFMKRFPWVLQTDGDPSVASHYPKAHFDGFEPFVSLPADMPELLLAALAGTLLCLARGKLLRPFRAPLCGALVGCALIFLWGVITFRYIDDMLPWLLVASSIAITYLAAVPSKALRYGLLGLFVAATAYAMWVNVALAVLQQRFLAYPIPPEKRLAFIDLCDAVDAGGLKGFLGYEVPWRRYIPAASFQEGNLLIDRTQFAARGDEPVLGAQGQPPFFASYLVTVPSEGMYDIAVRYAAGQPLPVHLLVNGRDVKQVCARPTGGWQDQEWDPGVRLRLARGVNRIGLASYTAVPPISMLRLTAAD